MAESDSLAVANADSNSLAAAWSGFERLPGLRQAALIVLLAGSLALAGAGVLWSQQPDYTLLLGNVPDSQKAEVIDALSRNGIKHRLDLGSGSILVPQADVHTARLRLAADNLLNNSAGGTGYELLDQDVGFTMTQRSEDSRHQRALEGELARSINSLSMVQSARVHMALARPSAFLRDRRQSSASVIVHLYDGKSLSERDVRGIVHVVAASVADMEPARVTVVDQNGRLLTKDVEQEEFSSDSERLDYTQRLEQRYMDRILDIVTPVIGSNGVHAQVVAEVDFTRSEQTEERFDPETIALRSEQTNESTTSEMEAQGIPGALSNQPPPAAEIGADDPAAQNPATPTQSNKTANRNFEVDRQVSHTQYAPGGLQRLSVAVVVDHMRSIDEEGAVTLTPRSEDEMARIQALVEKAVGFDAQRGDTVEVANVAFYQPPEAEPAVAAPIWEQPWLWQMGKQLLAPLGVVLLLLTIFRPTFRNLSTAPALPEPKPIETAEDQNALAHLDSNQMNQMVGQSRSIVAEDPARAAQVVSEWLADPA
ncbi:MAG: flagellar basal-body MS-ring/collar protein FliF [Pseudomonadota bacterium]